MEDKTLTIVTGHYGCGKTNYAVNLALAAAATGRQAALVDLDIVNPYFRTADFTGMLEKAGVRVLSPVYAGTNLDLPAIGAEMGWAFSYPAGWQIIVDMGGDDAGAAVLGRFSEQIRPAQTEMLYLANACRPLTRTPEEALVVLREIEAACRVKAGGIVNSTNLGTETTAGLIRQQQPYGQKLAALAEIPLRGVLADERLAASLGDVEGLQPVKIYVLPPWEPGYQPPGRHTGGAAGHTP